MSSWFPKNADSWSMTLTFEISELNLNNHRRIFMQRVGIQRTLALFNRGNGLIYHPWLPAALRLVGWSCMHHYNHMSPKTILTHVPHMIWAAHNAWAQYVYYRLYAWLPWLKQRDSILQAMHANRRSFKPVVRRDANHAWHTTHMPWRQIRYPSLKFWVQLGTRMQWCIMQSSSWYLFFSQGKLATQSSIKDIDIIFDLFLFLDDIDIVLIDSFVHGHELTMVMTPSRNKSAWFGNVYHHEFLSLAKA